MRHILLFTFTAVALFNLPSCTSSADENTADQIAMLKSENLRKDSLITESITYFNEIERNLSDIDLEEKKIKAEFEQLGSAGRGSKEEILMKIRYINDLRLENEKKIFGLQNKLSRINIAEEEFNKLLKLLQSKIKQKDKEMAVLQKVLEQKDKSYSELFAEYQQQLLFSKEQQLRNKAMTQNLNSVYFAIGTQKELVSSKVISVSKKGLSKRILLNENFSERSFKRSQIDKVNEIPINGKKVSLITNHPESTFSLIREGKQTKLKILNPELFWKFSKYLVVVLN